MGISRKTALTRIAGLSPMIEEHLAKIRTGPSAIDYDHWRGEALNWIAEVERMTRFVGRRTQAEVLRRVTQWKTDVG